MKRGIEKEYAVWFCDVYYEPYMVSNTIIYQLVQTHFFLQLECKTFLLSWYLFVLKAQAAAF